MIEVIRVTNRIFSSNTFIITASYSEAVWLVDIGDIDPVVEFLEKRGKKLKGLFLTHTHFDHIYGSNALTEKYPDVRIYTSGNGEKGLYCERLNLSRYYVFSFVYNYKNVSVIKEGSVIELYPEVNMEVIETPGHDWSCLCFRFNNNLFTGDAYIPGLKVITSFPQSNKKAAAASYRKIGKMLPECNLYPGHETTIRRF